MRMNGDLKLAGLIALTVHTGIFFYIPSSSRIEFDVQRAPSSIEVFLVSSRQKKLPQPPPQVKEKPEEKKDLKRPEKPDYFKPLQKAEEVKESERREEPAIKREAPPEKQLASQKSLAEETFISPKTKGAITEAKPIYLKNKPPLYPLVARKGGYEGTVLLGVEVLASGNGGRVKIIKSSGYSILDEAALKAVRRWKFHPARRGRTPVALWVEIPITFDLKERGWRWE